MSTIKCKLPTVQERYIKKKGKHENTLLEWNALENKRMDKIELNVGELTTINIW